MTITLLQAAAIMDALAFAILMLLSLNAPLSPE